MISLSLQPHVHISPSDELFYLLYFLCICDNCEWLLRCLIISMVVMLLFQIPYIINTGVALIPIEFIHRLLIRLPQHMLSSEMQVQMQRLALGVQLAGSMSIAVQNGFLLISCWLYADRRNASYNCQNFRNHNTSLNCSCQIEVEQKGIGLIDLSYIYNNKYCEIPVHFDNNYNMSRGNFKLTSRSF